MYRSDQTDEHACRRCAALITCCSNMGIRHHEHAWPPRECSPPSLNRHPERYSCRSPSPSRVTSTRRPLPPDDVADDHNGRNLAEAHAREPGPPVRRRDVIQVSRLLRPATDARLLFQLGIDACAGSTMRLSWPRQQLAFLSFGSIPTVIAYRPNSSFLGSRHRASVISSFPTRTPKTELRDRENSDPGQ